MTDSYENILFLPDSPEFSKNVFHARTASGSRCTESNSFMSEIHVRNARAISECSTKTAEYLRQSALRLSSGKTIWFHAEK